ncbi:LuxR family transcriptional regulator [Herbiconiux sp. VKM Ac-2851]|uniref:helix-turn-helix transcriptional regulator n=1 Tax=Herbiconiux sp. VKM Ac-2851 TaxID=2739025 RepID=UPI00156401C1|nr:LuxR family transcriptional regulator [Herbiconiux sp. VKM Ac-2851]NQX33753.1 hypothetical protein [Herbiconiux sp. VKM Ac-2851]
MTHDRERESQLEAARSSLIGGRGVMIFGSPGSGRSFFLRRLVEQVDEPTRLRLWIGDDLDRVDDVQLERLVRSIGEGSVLPVLTAVRGRLLREPLERLWREGLVDRIDLTPLEGSATLEIVEEFLGGRLDPDAVPALVPRRPGGDLVVLHDVVRESRTNGALTSRDGVWRLNGDLLPSPEVRRLIHSRIGTSVPVTPAVETLLDLISLAPELSLSRLERVMTTLEGGHPGDKEEAGQAFEALDGFGIIDTIDSRGTIRLRVHDPVIELLLPAMIGRLRRRRLSAAIVDLLSAGSTAVGESGGALQDTTALSAGEPIALARLSLWLGRDVDPAALTRSGELALRSARPQLAAQLALAAIERDGDVDASLVLAAAEAQLGRWDSALSRLAAIRGDVTGDPDRMRGVDELIEAVRSRSDASLPRWGSASGTSAPAPVLDLSAVLRLNVIELGDGASDSLSGDSRAALLRSEQLAVAASVATLRGERSRALELIDEGEKLLDGINADTFRMRFGRAIADVYDRPIPESIVLFRALHDEAAAAGQSVQQGLADELWGATQVVAGKAALALPVLARATEYLEAAGVVESALLARIAWAMASAAVGDIDAAVEQIESVLPRSVGVPYMEGWALQGLGVVQACQGSVDQAAASFVRAAESHEAHGLPQARIIALTESARAGNATSVLAQIEELSPQVEGACIAVTVKHSRALAALENLDGDLGGAGGLAGEFDAVGQAASRLGLHTYAAESYSHASALHAAGGDDRRASASARLCEEQIAACGGFRPPLMPHHSRNPLSGREQEIARMAAEGRSNREIAETLVLSVRTVETHLLRVYRKLGVRGRSELASALAGSGIGIPGAPKALQDSELNS